MHTLNEKAMESWNWANERGINVDPVKDIVEILYDQEIVSYCNQNGCVSFDYLDLVEA